MKTRIVLALAFTQLILAIQVLAVDNDSLSKAHYIEAKNKLVEMLDGKKPLSYEHAIYLIENAYWDNTIDTGLFKTAIDNHVGIIRNIAASNTAQPAKAPTEDLWEQMKAYRVQGLGYFDKAKTNWAIFTYMTDSSIVIRKDNFRYVIDKEPFHYSYKDPLGTIDWSNTQVVNLLASGSGNCFALTSLFKIFSERLNSDADICTAPGHVYITHKDHRGAMYNIEVASKSFPGTGTMETLTYTTNDAIKNDISLRQLNLKQSVALCLVYLAKGYEYKFKIRGGHFALQCAENALKYDSLSLNALLLKSEALETTLISKNKSVPQLQTDKTFMGYQELINKLYVLGYREMPLEMKNLLIKGRMHDSSVVIITKNHTPKTFDKLGVGYKRYASLSGGLFDEEIQNKPIEKYSQTLFDTKKKKITRFVKEDVLYNDYNFDPVVFALSVDPLAHKMPGWSPYAAFADNPIMNFDPNGAFPYSVHIRSFAPFETFGGGFDGDNRGYSTALGKGEGGTVTSRMQHRFTVDPTARTKSPGNSWSDESVHPLRGKATAKTHANLTDWKTTSDNDGNSTVTFGTNMAAANPLVPGSADIDIHTQFTIRENEKTGNLSISVVQTGDGFPSAETFIGDNSGNQLFIGVSPAVGGPYTSLPGDSKRNMMKADFNVSLDKKGNFTGVQQGDKTYSIQEWNDKMKQQPTTK